MKWIRSDWIIVILALVIICFVAHSLFLGEALAHGPEGSSKIRVNNEPVGPYILLVATSPEIMIVGSMNVWVRVEDEETDKLLRDAVVMVEATPHDGGSKITAQATHEHAGNAFDYVAHLQIEDSGQWDFTVTVVDDPGQADFTFSDTVRGGSPTNLITALGIFLVVLVLAVGFLLARQSARVTQHEEPV